MTDVTILVKLESNLTVYIGVYTYGSIGQNFYTLTGTWYLVISNGI